MSAAAYKLRERLVLPASAMHIYHDSCHTEVVVVEAVSTKAYFICKYNRHTDINVLYIGCSYVFSFCIYSSCMMAFAPISKGFKK